MEGERKWVGTPPAKSSELYSKVVWKPHTKISEDILNRGRAVAI